MSKIPEPRYPLPDPLDVLALGVSLLFSSVIGGIGLFVCAVCGIPVEKVLSIDEDGEPDGDS